MPSNLSKREGVVWIVVSSENDFILLGLGDVLARYGEERLLNVLSKFKSKCSDKDRFIGREALDRHKRNINRTYLLYRKNLSRSFEENIPVAFFSIALTSIVFTERSELDEKIRKSLNITFNEPKVAYLIGHLAKIENEESGMIDVLMPRIKSLFVKVQDILGGNIICLDCDIKKLENRYIEHGFTILGKSPDAVGSGFKRMFSVISRETN